MAPGPVPGGGCGPHGSLAVGPAFAQEERYQQPTLNPRVKSIMEVDGYQFIDLNSNGELDVYEDWRQDARHPRPRTW